MNRLLMSCVALGVVAVMAYPFARDAYNRYELMRRLSPVLSEQDRMAFRAWNGNAQEFVKALHARCEIMRGAGNPNCAPYRLALD